ncbi:MAG TPA: hypothetical protein DEP72_02160 [Clostridiales bacterium]|nr:MAG: hypothetical protein A2Y18_00350 [Clostridiales bacterium GWD2_32_19]HCC06960.1 hypothetical protein [Clostridiales bacterium]
MKRLILLLVMVSMFLIGGTVSKAEKLNQVEIEKETVKIVQTLDKIKDRNTLDEKVVKIVSGLESKYQPTFDKYRIVSGEAKQGTYVTVWKYKKSVDNKIVLNEITLHTIGASEIFSDLIELDLGKNFILIQGEKDISTTAAEYCLNRKDARIQLRLKAMPLLFNSNKIDFGFLR